MADIEIGGTDQKFNLLVGRALQKHFGQNPQVVITLPILEGLDGVQKMSKSLGNYIGINDAPGDMYAKILSIRDELIWRYFELVSLQSVSFVADLREKVCDGMNPREAKMILAKELIERFHGIGAAQNASASAGNKLAYGSVPDDIDEIILSADDKDHVSVSSALRLMGLAKNSNGAHALLKQGAIYVDGAQVDQGFAFVVGDRKIVQAGRRKVLRVIVVR